MVEIVRGYVFMAVNMVSFTIKEWSPDRDHVQPMQRPDCLCCSPVFSRDPTFAIFTTGSWTAKIRPTKTGMFAYTCIGTCITTLCHSHSLISFNLSSLFYHYYYITLNFAGTNVWYLCWLAQKRKNLYPQTLSICIIVVSNVTICLPCTISAYKSQN